MKLLFELFTEELPASEMSGLDNRTRDTLCSLLDSNDISYKNFRIYITPRRIAVKFECDDTINAQTKKITGPPENICFKDGKPTKALDGFLKKNNASLDDIEIEETKKGKYVSVVLKGESKSVKPLLPEIMHNFLHKLHFNKKMRWGSGEHEFIRPIHNITFTIDDEIIDFTFADIPSTSYTYGHRFLSSGKIKITYDNYESELEKGFVIVDQNKRKQIILDQLDSICKKHKMDVIYDNELLDEVVNLTEYPRIVLGSFEEKFLKLPKEVLITSMKDHQRYFAFTKNSSLANNFAAVSNIETDNMDIIKTGYERVLRARFADAEFFFAEDTKHRLEEFVAGLNKMTFQEKLGSQYERVLRLMELSSHIASKLNFPIDKAMRAAYLSKADLLTQMVYEFPELQGVMGREYALLSGEDKEVAEAIYEQYLPKEEEVAKTQAGIALSLADKFDLIVGGFIANLKPTGTKDPYALRRAALGIIKTVLENSLSFDLRNFIKKSATLYKKEVGTEDIVDFIKVRFNNHLSQYPHDALSAVLESEFNDIYDAYLRLEALNNLFLNDPNKEKRFAIKRVFNIVKDYDKTDVDDSLFTQNEEKTLFSAIKNIEKNIKAQKSDKKYDEILNSIIEAKDIINAFFDNVMVMDKDERIKNNRLSLLNRLKNIVLNVADFKFLEI
jgi:glycyl-tRNA synthetase beta chain